jgi:hypothetical protein
MQQLWWVWWGLASVFPVGLLVFTIAVFFPLQQKGVVIPVAIQVSVLLLVIMSYAYTILRDVRHDEIEIENFESSA